MKCIVCEQDKALNEFKKKAGGKVGHPITTCEKCKQNCKNKTARVYYWRHRESCREKMAEFRKNNPTWIPLWKKRNKEKLRTQERAWKKIKRLTDPNFKLCDNFRRRVNIALKGKIKSERTMKLIGCHPDFLRKFLEDQFTTGMTWENYSYTGWHVHHIKACKDFDLTDPIQQKVCFHYSNLKPMWVADHKLTESYGRNV